MRHKNKVHSEYHFNLICFRSFKAWIIVQTIKSETRRIGKSNNEEGEKAEEVSPLKPPSPSFSPLLGSGSQWKESELSPPCSTTLPPPCDKLLVQVGIYFFNFLLFSKHPCQCATDYRVCANVTHTKLFYEFCFYFHSIANAFSFQMYSYVSFSHFLTFSSKV